MRLVPSILHACLSLPFALGTVWMGAGLLGEGSQIGKSTGALICRAPTVGARPPSFDPVVLDGCEVVERRVAVLESEGVPDDASNSPFDEEPEEDLYADHPGPFSLTPLGMRKIPHDPIQPGACKLYVRFHDQETGLPFSSDLQLWRLDAQENLNWTAGAQLVSLRRPKQVEHDLLGLAVGRYVVVALDAREGSPFCEPFELTSSRVMHLPVAVPRSLDVSVALVQPGGMLIRSMRGRLTKSPRQRRAVRPAGAVLRVTRGNHGFSSHFSYRGRCSIGCGVQTPELESGANGFVFRGLLEDSRQWKRGRRLSGTTGEGVRVNVFIPTIPLRPGEVDRRIVVPVAKAEHFENGFITPQGAWADPKEWRMRQQATALLLDPLQSWHDNWSEARLNVSFQNEHWCARDVKVHLGDLPLAHSSQKLRGSGKVTRSSR